MTTFRHVREFEGWEAAPNAVRDLLERFGSRHVLEIGGGANPTLTGADGLDYTVNDASAAELAKGRHSFETLVADFSEPLGSGLPVFDFVFSRMVNEHVSNGAQYYENIRRLLKPGGVTAHWFSTLYAAPFLLNATLPDTVSKWMLNIVYPGSHEKFRAHYDWSRGPSKNMVQRFEGLGFRVLRYDGYFGHNYYRALPWLHAVEMKKADVLTRFPVPALCSYASLILQKR